jgi:plastocyanin
VRRRAAVAAMLATLSALVIAPAALAQGPAFQAVDDLAGTNNNRWEPGAVTVKVGDTVTWRFDGTILAHNVDSTSLNWNLDTPASTQVPTPVSYTFTAEGVYEFVCRFHADTMKGTVTVGSPPPPPPPPLSEQHWVNDQQPPTVFEVADEVRPRLSRLRVTSVRDGARIRFRLSERARVIVRFKLAGLTVKTARRTFRKGAGSLTVRDPRMHGRYAVDVLARDLSGNRSRIKRARLMIR